MRSMMKALGIIAVIIWGLVLLLTITLDTRQTYPQLFAVTVVAMPLLVLLLHVLAHRERELSRRARERDARLLTTQKASQHRLPAEQHAAERCAVDRGVGNRVPG